MKKNATLGLTLMELVIALAISALLVLGLVQITAAASSSTQLQRNQAQVQENARLAFKTLSHAIHRAGFNPQPWSTQFPQLNLLELSLDSVTSAGDRLAIRDWSDLNCFDNRNPDTDTSGNSAFYIREFTFDINTDKNLTLQCRYGPTLANLRVQVRRQGLVRNIESFQLLFGEDADGDGSIDSWVRAENWTNMQDVLGVRIGLLLSSEEAVLKPEPLRLQVLDSTIDSPADGRLRRVSWFTTAIKGRAG